MLDSVTPFCAGFDGLFVVESRSSTSPVHFAAAQLSDYGGAAGYRFTEFCRFFLCL